MRKYLLFTLLMGLSYSFSFAQDKGFGIGVILGEPTGISAKYWLNNTNAFDYALGSTLSSGGNFHLHVDYLWHAYNVFQSTEIFTLYYGPGVRVKTRSSSQSLLGIRGVMGIAWFVNTAPLDVFVEIVPVLNLAPSLDMSVNAGIGTRYFFN